MSEHRRLAVIVLRNNIAVPPLTIDQAKRMFVTDENAVLKYWRDNAENWFNFAPVDFFGSYDVMIGNPPGSRASTLMAARTAAENDGKDLSPYDNVIVYLHPGNSGGQGYDAGTLGLGSGAACVLPTTDDRTFFCHETGHALGFDHTYGILNSGADWNHTGALFSVYGDPYDLMSSASFGGANPEFSLPSSQTIPNFPNGLKAGPMLSRANLHFTKPGALEATQKVHHVYEDGVEEVVTLYPAGQGEAGKCELVVYHPANEEESGRGRVYVEYRQPFSFNYASRWDAGFTTDGAGLDNCGLVVHVVKEIPGSASMAVWYAGRLVFPSPDADLQVDTPRGSATVTVSDEFVQAKTPAFLRVRINRQNNARVSIIETASEQTDVLHSEMRFIPGWEWAGKFTWERRQTIRTVVYTPLVFGRGGSGVVQGPVGINVYWYLGGSRPGPAESGNTSVPTIASGGGRASMDYSIDKTTLALTLSNVPPTGPFSITVHASASDQITVMSPITADTTFAVNGVSEGWGADYKHFMDMWYQITHPKPKHRFGPPDPEGYRSLIDDLLHVYDKLRAVNPEVAVVVQPFVLNQAHSLQKAMNVAALKGVKEVRA